jgi:acyl-CoA thioester hydrolase
MEKVAEYRVIYGDTDRMGVVYYGNFLRLFEIARAELIRRRGRPYRLVEDEDGVMLPVVEARVRYRTPARYDDLLALHIAVGKVGGATVAFSYEVRRADDGVLLAEGETLHATVDRQGRPRRMPAQLRALMVEPTGSATAASTATVTRTE